MREQATEMIPKSRLRPYRFMSKSGECGLNVTARVVDEFEAFLPQRIQVIHALVIRIWRQLWDLKIATANSKTEASICGRHLTVPVVVGTRTSAPRTASVRLTGKVRRMSSPSLVKKLCGLTSISTSASPGFPPPRPGAPLPRRRSI